MSRDTQRISLPDTNRGLVINYKLRRLVATNGIHESRSCMACENSPSRAVLPELLLLWCVSETRQLEYFMYFVIFYLVSLLSEIFDWISVK